MIGSIDICKAQACKQDVFKDGYCKKHYYYYVTMKFQEARKQNKNECVVFGCCEKPFAMGLCKRHNSQFHKYEEILEKTRTDPQTIEIEGDITKIYFRNKIGEDYDFFIIDTEDLERAIQYKWRKSNTGYATTDDENHGHLRYHNFILNRDYKGEKYIIVDHINGVKLDCRKSNLRVTDRRNNQRNTGLRKVNTSGVTGARWKNSNNHYIAEITVNRKTINIGSSNKFDDVVKWRIQEEAKIFREYSPNYNRDTQTIQLTYHSHDDGLPTFIESDLFGTIITHHKLPQ